MWAPQGCACLFYLCNLPRDAMAGRWLWVVWDGLWLAFTSRWTISGLKDAKVAFTLEQLANPNNEEHPHQ